jgi:hypothetical protein
MRNETYKGKRIVWENKAKQIFHISICLIFTSIGLFLGKFDTLLFWITLLLFGGGGVFMLIKLLNPHNLFVTPNSKLAKEIISEREESFKNDYGIFNYDEIGFIVELETIKKHYDWNEIETVYGYKVDLLAYDEICLDIFTKDEKYFTITESSLGWFQFVTRLSQNITSIREEWFFEIANPAFQKNLTLLYDKYNRTSQEIKKHYS